MCSRLLTGFAEEVDGMRQLGLLQLQLALLDELQQLLVPQDGELRGNLAPLLQDAALQLHVAVGNELTHHRLALDLPQRRMVRPRRRSRSRRQCPTGGVLTLKLPTSLTMALRSLVKASESSQADTMW